MHVRFSNRISFDKIAVGIITVMPQNNQVPLCNVVIDTMKRSQQNKQIHNGEQSVKQKKHQQRKTHLFVCFVLMYARCRTHSHILSGGSGQTPRHTMKRNIFTVAIFFVKSGWPPRWKRTLSLSVFLALAMGSCIERVEFAYARTHKCCCRLTFWGKETNYGREREETTINSSKSNRTTVHYSNLRVCAHNQNPHKCDYWLASSL